MIYQPSDDSYLLASVLKKYSKNKKILDIGTGSGIQALTALKSGASFVIASDINPEAKDYLKEHNIPFIHSDLFSSIIDKFDLIIFNSPYLPEDKREPSSSALSTTGGKHGDETILKFLKQAKLHLNKNGIILLLLSSLTPKEKIKKLLNKLGFHHNVIASKKLFMETLYVWEISPRTKSL
jgi:release factor glutamine methyltransferase